MRKLEVHTKVSLCILAMTVVNQILACSRESAVGISLCEPWTGNPSLSSMSILQILDMLCLEAL